MAEEVAKSAHIKNAIMAGMYFGQDNSGKAKKLDQVLEEKRKARVRALPQLGMKATGANGAGSDVLTKVWNYSINLNTRHYAATVRC